MTGSETAKVGETHVMKNIGLILTAVSGLAASAFGGVAPGDIVYTSFNRNAIRLISDPGGVPSTSTLVSYGGTFGMGSYRLSGITQAGNGNFYVGNGPIIGGDNDWDTSEILEVSNLFGVPSTTTFLSGAGADPLQNPVDVVWNAAANHLLWVQNPFRRTGIGQIVNDGLYGSPIIGPSTTQFFAEDTSGPRPFYEAGVYMAPDYQNPGSYYVTSLNGGSHVAAGDDTQGSTLWRFTPNYGNPALSTLTLVADLSTTSLGMPIAQLRGVASRPGENALYVTNNFAYTGNAAAGVYKILLDGAGNYVDIMALNTTIVQPEAIEYNPFTGKLVIASFDNLDVNGPLDQGKIYQMNLDGSGLQVLVEDFARDFYIIPTPGAIALLTLGGLVALRRRR